MEQRGARDVDRWKDKIEVRLDNRQVAFLFFGSALVACLLFILGVIVGKRLESRGRALAPEFEDPLALLDRVASTSVPPRREETASPPAASPRPQTTSPRPPAPARPSPPSEAAVKKVVVAPPVAPPSSAQPAPETRSEAVPVTTVKEAGKPRARFMLQIGSFPDRAEAEAFAASFSLERPIVVVSEIPGKGTWYRVRFGGFQAFREAVDAKLVFEKRHNKIALVVGPL